MGMLDVGKIPPEIVNALVLVLLAVIPVMGQIIVACLRERLAVIETKLDRNTRLTLRTLESQRTGQPTTRATDGPNEVNE